MYIIIINNFNINKLLAEQICENVDMTLLKRDTIFIYLRYYQLWIEAELTIQLLIIILIFINLYRNNGIWYEKN